jgi:hypothetical protein
MAVATTDVAVASMALVLIGDDPISAFDGSTSGAIVAENIYDGVVEDMLSQHPWRFAIKQDDLSHLSAAPDAIWSNAWQIPTDMLTVRRVTVNGSDIDYEIYADKIYCGYDNTNTLTMNYIFRAVEQDWPPYFRYAVQMQLASLFAMAVIAKPDMAGEFATLADFALRRARSVDSQSDTTHEITTTRFITNRR